MWVRFKRFIKQCLPFFIHQRLDAKRKRLGRLECPICNKRVIQFEMIDRDYLEQCDRHQIPLSLFTYETLNVLGYHCPECGTADRTRLYALYLRQVFSAWNKNETFRVLDIAPTPPLTRFLKGHPFVNYRSADLYSPLADDRVDVMDMHIYADQTFDFVIFSHVLEHLSDDRRALCEIFRVMKRGAKAIIMVPIDLTRQSVDEDPLLTDEGARWRRFGQNDHVRLYSKEGFVERLVEVGFVVDQLGVEHFGEETFRRCGIHPRSVLYVAEKK